MSGTNNGYIKTLDLYKAALQIATGIQVKLEETGEANKPPFGLDMTRRDLIERKACPHESFGFDGDVTVSLKKKAWERADKMDKRTMGAIRGVLKGFSEVKPPKEMGPVGKLLSRLASGFSDSAKGDSAHTLHTKREEMLYVLRTLSTALSGEYPTEKEYAGHFSPKIDRLKLDKIPKTHEGWMDIADKMRKAMAPQPVDECVVDYTLGQVDSSKGFSLLKSGGNTDIGVSDKPDWSIRVRSYYGRDMVSFSDEDSAKKAFETILNARSLGDVHKAVRDKRDGEWDLPVNVRHTSSGNFLGGSFTSDKYHPNEQVRAAAASPPGP